MLSVISATRLFPVLILVGVLLTLNGGYIHAKALLGQYLIKQAWRETLATGSPNRPWFWMDTWPVNRLLVKRLGVEQIVLAGDGGQSLAFGPGHRTGSALPGEPGVTLISGHRDTHFGFVEQLRLGDRLTLERPDGSRVNYRFRAFRVVNADAEIAPDESGQTLILATCWPFGSDALEPAYRYLAIAEPEPVLRS